MDELLLGRVYEWMHRRAAVMVRHYPELRNMDLADDLAHEAFLRLLRTQAVERPQTEEYLRNLAAQRLGWALSDLLRKERLADRILKDAWKARSLRWVTDPEDDPARVALWTEFRRHIDALPPGVKEVLELRYSRGVSERNTALELGVSPRTVRRRWQSACRLLAPYLRGWLDFLVER